jgi:hypothetical protein
VENVKIGVKEFLSLPMEEKKKFWQTAEDIEGFGQLFIVSENQKLEWADLFFTTTLPSYARNPRLFPNIPQPFRFYIFFSRHFCLLATMLSIANREKIAVCSNSATRQWYIAAITAI